MSSPVLFQTPKSLARPWAPEGAGETTSAAMLPLKRVSNVDFLVTPMGPAGTSSTIVQMPKGPSPTVLSASAGSTLERRLFDALAAMKIKTAEVAMHMSSEWRDKLFAYLDFLHDDESWDEQDEPAVLGSFVTFLRMSLYLKPQRGPGMGLTSKGNLVATWTVGRRDLTIECIAGDEVLWSVSVPADDGVETAAGRCAILRLTNVLMPYQPERWFSNDGQAVEGRSNDRSVRTKEQTSS